MGKKKTLRQKKLTDMRKQQVSHTEDSSPTNIHLASYSFSPSAKQSSFAPIAQKTVTADIRKTALISLSIIAMQIILFVLLQNHVLALPFVRY